MSSLKHGVRLSVYPVKDINQAVAQYSKLLGVEPYFAGAYYAGFHVGDVEIGLDPNGHHRRAAGPIDYWQVDDIQQRFQEFLAAGAVEEQAVKDVGSGKLIASVKDADGNIIGLIQMP